MATVNQSLNTRSCRVIEAFSIGWIEVAGETKSVAIIALNAEYHHGSRTAARNPRKLA